MRPSRRRGRRQQQEDDDSTILASSCFKIFLSIDKQCMHVNLFLMSKPISGCFCDLHSKQLNADIIHGGGLKCLITGSHEGMFDVP